ncbi:MAG TPA: glycosyltransferase [Verrucomicrobiae bacterium]|nr:glycosyltransferase [Verrucomicrobiae bacterium]
MNFSEIMFHVIAGLSLLNFARIAYMLLGADLYDIRHARKQAAKKRPYKPLITVIIPAYNEEVGVLRTLTSVLENNYSKKQVIVVNDGSTDRTLAKLRNFQRKHQGRFTIVNQQNSGKATAINRAVSHWAKGKLVMVVDADSVLDRQAIGRMVEHFRDPRVVASAANVKIIPHRALLGIVQRFEYLISYRLKRASTLASMEYIVGGVGSTFRKSALVKVGLYDTDTMTEDIDVTLKLIRQFGNRYYRINYAADAIAFTEHVLSFRSLIRQRFRWKYGRMQSLFKNSQLFFSKDKKYRKQLTWYQLPYAVFGEVALLLEPLLVGFILVTTVLFFDLTSLVSVYLIVTGFVFLLVLGEETETLPAKLLLSALLPLLYFLLYILSVVEFAALVQSIKNAPQLLRRSHSTSSWEHVERIG